MFLFEGGVTLFGLFSSGGNTFIFGGDLPLSGGEGNSVEVGLESVRELQLESDSGTLASSDFAPNVD